jgi:hypothetical protein
MNLPNTSEPEIQALGGEPLEESGFENEKPSPVFQPYEQLGQEGSAR